MSQTHYQALRTGWKCFWLTTTSPSQGAHTDAVGVRPQSGSEQIRLIEIESQPEKGQRLQRKFDRTGRAVLSVVDNCELVPELHVKPLPRTSQPFRFAPVINGVKIPVTLWADGKRA